MDSELNAKIPISHITQQVTMNVEVTGIRAWRWRVKIAGWLLALAARVAGVGLQIQTETKKNG